MQVRETVRTHTPTRLTRLMSVLTFSLLLALLIAVNVGCMTKQPTPSKPPVPTVAPKPPAPVKACPAATRYNPKTGSCDKIRL